MLRKIILWLVFAAPLVGGTLGGIFACVDVYRDGWDFVPGLHVFKWFLVWFWGGIAIFGAFLLGLLTLIISCKWMKVRVPQGPAVTLLLMGLLIPGITLVLVPVSFESGRDAAYASLDLPRLVEDCRQLQSRVKSPTESNEYDGVMIVDRRWKGAYTGLPGYLQALHPLFVWQRGSLVVIQMDGGGVASHEGLLVDSNMSPEAFSRICRKNNMQALDPNYPVARYGAYDWRQAADFPWDGNRHPG